jgi:hypothetical protein
MGKNNRCAVSGGIRLQNVQCVVFIDQTRILTSFAAGDLGFYER